MSEQDIIRRIQIIFREIFDDESLAISADTTAEDIVGWDSLAHINLLVAIEADFAISFSLEELQTAKKVDALVKLVAGKAA